MYYDDDDDNDGGDDDDEALRAGDERLSAAADPYLRPKVDQLSSHFSWAKTSKQLSQTGFHPFPKSWLKLVYMCGLFDWYCWEVIYYVEVGLDSNISNI